MRKAALLALVGLIALAPSIQAEGLVGAGYEWDGPHGALTIVGAMPGTPFIAMDAFGRVVARGPVFGPHMVIPCMNSGPSPEGVILTLRVGTKFFVFHVEDEQDLKWL